MWQKLSLLVVVALAFPACGSSRFRPIDQEPASGFAIYRSGTPSDADLKTWCNEGITEVLALNGEGSAYKTRFEQICPGAQVIYDQKQDPDARISEEFLAYFDEVVAQAKADGKKLLFHCYCGCHRTGRLAAYYRIKYNGWDAEKAIEEMNEIGDDMDHHPTLPDQIRALEAYVRGTPCSQAAEFCLNPLASVANEARISPPSEPRTAGS